jgi:hypothetical protein
MTLAANESKGAQMNVDMAEPLPFTPDRSGAARAASALGQGANRAGANPGPRLSRADAGASRSGRAR